MSSKRLSSRELDENNMTEVKTRQPRKKGRRLKPKIDSLQLTNIEPLTDNQKRIFDHFADGYNILADGSAGTGKSFSASFLALKELFSNNIEKIVIIRSAVEGRKRGHLPGTLDDKDAPFTVPYKCIVNDLCDCGTAWDTLTKAGAIEFMSTSFLRSLTLDNCVIIVDEIQNLDKEELETVLTRVGNNSRFILIGDVRQDDLKRNKETSCYGWLIKLIEMPLMKKQFKQITFVSEDIVRSELCKDIIMSIEDMNV